MNGYSQQFGDYNYFESTQDNYLQFSDFSQAGLRCYG